MNTVQPRTEAAAAPSVDVYLAEHPPLDLSADFISSTLSIYRHESIAVVAAKWRIPTLTALVRNLSYPFTIPGHIEYMTASMAMLYLSQASYLTARLLIHSDLVPPGMTIDEQDFFAARDAGDLVFTEVSVRFRHKLMLDGGPFALRLEMENLRKLRSLLLADFSCVMGNRACMAKGVFAMPSSAD